MTIKELHEPKIEEKEPPPKSMHIFSSYTGSKEIDITMIIKETKDRKYNIKKKNFK